MDKQLRQQLTKEINAINRTFRAFKIRARTTPGLTGIGGDQLIIYRLEVAAGQAINNIDSLLPELSERISAARRQRTLVRLLQFPLRLEVEHPFRKSLLWDRSALGSGQSHAMLLGRTYDNGARDIWLPIDDARHTLVAGATGAGKSVLVNGMVCGLAWHTSPADLRIALIDLKNTDLVPLARLPHVDVLATDNEPAYGVLAQAFALMERRKAEHVNTPRLLVVVDEYTDLIDDKQTMFHVDRIARQGRSFNINFLVATQHPTSKALGGSTIKTNFLARCVGQVTDASAASNATGRRGTHAELLPDMGAFLYIRGAAETRFQSYKLTGIDVESMITKIGRRWSGETTNKVLIPSSTTRRNHVSTRVVEPSRTAIVERIVEQPVELSGPVPARDEVDEIADMIAEMYADGASKNAMCQHVFGRNFAGSYAGKINAAIERLQGREQPTTNNKIIRLPRTGTGGD